MVAAVAPALAFTADRGGYNVYTYVPQPFVVAAVAPALVLIVWPVLYSGGMAYVILYAISQNQFQVM